MPLTIPHSSSFLWVVCSPSKIRVVYDIAIPTLNHITWNRLAMWVFAPGCKAQWNFVLHLVSASWYHVNPDSIDILMANLRYFRLLSCKRSKKTSCCPWDVPIPYYPILSHIIPCLSMCHFAMRFFDIPSSTLVASWIPGMDLQGRSITAKWTTEGEITYGHVGKNTHIQIHTQKKIFNNFQQRLTHYHIYIYISWIYMFHHEYTTPNVYNIRFSTRTSGTKASRILSPGLAWRSWECRKVMLKGT